MARSAGWSLNEIPVDSEGRPLVVHPQEGKQKHEYKPDWPAREGYTWVCTIFGSWVQLDNSSAGVPCVDPSYERYWCM